MEDIFIINTQDFQLSQWDFIIRMLTTVGIGLVVGLEREFSIVNQKEKFAGLRTFSIISLLGFTSALMSAIINEYIFIAGFLSVVVIVAIYYKNTTAKGNIGSTTEFTAISMYLLGGMMFFGHIEAALALTVIIVLLLSLKLKFKTFVGLITHAEVSAFIRFVVMALLILPFLPNSYYGPYSVINPRDIGWVVVLISGIGFMGYLSMKFFGANKGILFTGIFGGLISSTMITYEFSDKSKVNPTLSANYAQGIFAASTIMISRVVIIVFIFNATLLDALKIPMALLFLTSLGITYYYYKKSRDNADKEEQIVLGEPLNIKTAIIFGLFFTGILLLVSFANEHYGSEGIYVTSAISALTDIDAITISVSKLALKNINFLTAQNAILLATLTNTIVKIGIAIWKASPDLKKYVIFGYGLIFIAGIFGFIYLNA